MEYFTALSSEVYHIDPKDLEVLEDIGAAVPEISSDKVVILLGNSRKGMKDRLYQGRDVVQKAIKEGKDYIPVRIAFHSRAPLGLNFIVSLAKGIRKHFKGFGSNVYHVRREDLENLKIERGVRTEENAYRFSSRRWMMTEHDRNEWYVKMETSFKEKGFDDKYPMDILLLRAFGVKDNLHQGHHRMMFSRQFDIDRVAVRFAGASHMTPFLRPVFVGLAKLCGKY